MRPDISHNKGVYYSIRLYSRKQRFDNSYLASLATSFENMASNSERIMENSRNFHIVYVGRTNLCKHCTTNHARGIRKLGISQPPHSPIAELWLPLEVVTISSAWFGLVYWGLTPQQQPGSNRGGEMMMMMMMMMIDDEVSFLVEETGVPGGNRRPANGCCRVQPLLGSSEFT